MDRFVITGGKRLKGTVRVNGAKNAALPIMAASLLAEGQSTISDVPHLADVEMMGLILGSLGVAVSRNEGGDLKLCVEDESHSHARYDQVRKMRASICVLGPMLAKRKTARVAMPGGCQIGTRPVNLHLRGLRALGAEIELDEGDIVASARKLRGAEIFLGGPFGSTVLGTANGMMAATLAEGSTVIEGAACEPELADLADYLNRMGARISGAGTPHVVVEGVEHRDIPNQLITIAHHQGDLAQVVTLSFKGLKTQDPSLATGGVQQARKHLERGGLASAIGP